MTTTLKQISPSLAIEVEPAPSLRPPDSAECIPVMAITDEEPADNSTMEDGAPINPEDWDRDWVARADAQYD